MAPEMNDVFAAFSTAGVGPSPQRGEFADPEIVSTSIYSIFGTEDGKVSEILEPALPFPFTAEQITADPNFSTTLQTATAMLGLEMGVVQRN